MNPHLSAPHPTLAPGAQISMRVGKHDKTESRVVRPEVKLELHQPEGKTGSHKKGDNESPAPAKASMKTPAWIQKLRNFWKKWHKFLLIGGGTLTLGASAIGLAAFERNRRMRNARLDAVVYLPEAGAIEKELLVLQNILDQAINKGNFDLPDKPNTNLSVVNFLQNALQLHRLKPAVSPEKIDGLMKSASDVALTYSILFEQDQLRAVVQQLRGAGALPRRLTDKQVTEHDLSHQAIDGALVTLKKYLNEARGKESWEPNLFANFEGFEQLYEAVTLLNRYGWGHEALGILKNDLPQQFLRLRVNNTDPDSRVELLANTELVASFFRAHVDGVNKYRALQEFADQNLMPTSSQNDEHLYSYMNAAPKLTKDKLNTLASSLIPNQMSQDLKTKLENAQSEAEFTDVYKLLLNEALGCVKENNATEVGHKGTNAIARLKNNQADAEGFKSELSAIQRRLKNREMVLFPRDMYDLVKLIQDKADAFSNAAKAELEDKNALKLYQAAAGLSKHYGKPARSKSTFARNVEQLKAYSDYEKIERMNLALEAWLRETILNQSNTSR